MSRLWDSQWVNIVNAPEVLNAADKEEAVSIAVRLTEQAMAKNAALAAKPAVPEELLERIKEAIAAWNDRPKDAELAALRELVQQLRRDALGCDRDGYKDAAVIKRDCATRIESILASGGKGEAYCYAIAGMVETTTGEVNFLCNKERKAESDIALFTTPSPAASVASNVVDVSEIKGLLSEVDDYLNGCPNPEKVWPKWLIKKSSRLLWRCRSILSNHLLPRNVDSEADTGGRSDGE